MLPEPRVVLSDAQLEDMLTCPTREVAGYLLCLIREQRKLGRPVELVLRKVHEDPEAGAA